MARGRHQVRPTLLAVGEGDSELAFLRHLRSMYCAGGAGVAVSVTVRNAHGLGPEHVIDFAAAQAKAYSYDKVVALLDTDIPWTDKLLKTARKARIEMVGSTPCLEGLLLSILRKRPPGQSDACKRAIQQELGVDLTEVQSYAAHFPKAVLDEARVRLSELNRLIQCFEGGRIG